MNWGYRVVIAFVLFMGFIITLVVYTSTTSSDLVAEDYYNQEVNYQAVIDAKKNSKGIESKIVIQQDANEINISFPEEVTSNAKGKVHFYHPQSSDKDFIKELNISNDNVQSIKKSFLAKGNYKVKINWEQEGKSYYVEKSCYVS